MKSKLLKKISEIKTIIQKDDLFLDLMKKERNKLKNNQLNPLEANELSEKILTMIVKKIDILLKEKKLFLIIREKNFKIEQGICSQDIEIEIIDCEDEDTSSVIFVNQAIADPRIHLVNKLITKIQLISNIFGPF